jgi:hypothetical protein
LVTISRNVETVVKEGNLNKFSYKTTAKNFKSWLEHKIGVFSKMNNEEYRQVFMEILRAYNHFEKVVPVEIKGWKGKSSFEMFTEADKIVVTKYQRETKDSEPSEIKFIFTKEEVSSLIKAINYLESKYPNNEHKSLDIAFQYVLNLGIRTTSKGKNMFSGDFREMFYSERTLHNRFTILLNVLEKQDFISYKGGLVKVLKQLDIQTILNV